jgi:hypothetical protein
MQKLFQLRRQLLFRELGNNTFSTAWRLLRSQTCKKFTRHLFILMKVIRQKMPAQNAPSP